MLDFLSPLLSWSVSQSLEDISSSQLRDSQHQHEVLVSLLKRRGGQKAKRIEQARLLNLLGEPISQPWGSVAVCLHLYARRFPKTNWLAHLGHFAVAEEAATRIGLHLLLQPEGKRSLWMRIVAILVYHARLRSFSANALKETIAIAAAFIQSTAHQGISSAPHLLDTLALSISEQSISHYTSGTRYRGDISWSNGVRLHHAFLGLGTITFSKVRVFNGSLGPLRHRLAFEAVNEIFKRHVKAADKPLRPDQLTRIRIEQPSRMAESVGLTRETLCNSLSYAISMVLLTRGIDESAIDWDWIDRHELEIRDIAQRIECVFSECRFVQLWEDQINALGPLFANIDTDQLIEVLGIKQWRNKLKLKRCIARQRYMAFDSKYFQLDSWVPQQPTRVELFTSRGGKWPEERAELSGLSGRYSDSVQNLLDALQPASSSDSLSMHL